MQQKTRLVEGSLNLETYGIGQSPSVPIFYEGRSNQGAQGHVYPYALQDKLSAERQQRQWRCLTLENDYVSFCVLPELGGRLFRAVDKINGYDFFYRQDVIKPALIGVLGAWFSGGVEWNFPHHHRTTTFMPTDYRLEESDDGSATIWLAENERRHRLRWELGMTLAPGSSCLRVRLCFCNYTAVPQSFLYWANAAVHANEDYQVIFPPDVSHAVYHAKDQACDWPMFSGQFKGIQYEQTDLSFWKNHPAPGSFFCSKSREDFFGGYDHGRRSGVIICADRHVAEGKKFFLWGNNEHARTWDQNLTDKQGPYLELMAGAYSDNQPDYTWLQPGEEKYAEQFFYPIREIGIVKRATPLAAVNLSASAEGLFIGVQVTEALPAACLSLTGADGELLKEWTLELTPAKAFTAELPLALQPGMTLTLKNAAAQSIVSYSATPGKSDVVPPTLTRAPAKPEDFASVEELYYAGQRLEQFHNAVISAEPYYAEALKRDPNDYRCCVAVAIRRAKQGLWQEAEELLRRAVGRATANNTTPQQGDAFYYLGVVLQAQEQYDEAEDCLHQACWYPAHQAAAYYALAEIAAARQDALSAKAFLQKCPGERAQRLDKILSGDLYDDGYRLADLVQRQLDNACVAMGAGCWQGALRHLDAGGPYPLLHYYRAYCLSRLNRQEEALAAAERGAAAVADYCFPFRWESEKVLRNALSLNSQDGMAYYYLGCLLRYQERPEEALAAWEKARELGLRLGNLYFCLSQAYAKKQRHDEAANAMQEAMLCETANPIFLRELDRIAERKKVPAEERLAFLRSRQDIVNERDDVLLRELLLLNQCGHYDEALALMDKRRFYVWEGNEIIVHEAFVDAHLQRGQQRLAAGQAALAKEDFTAALEYPPNLGVGRPYHDVRSHQLYYYVGLACKALGDQEGARDFFERAVARTYEESVLNQRLNYLELPYHQVLALRELGRHEEAQQYAARASSYYRRILGGDQEQDFFAKFGDAQATAPRQKTALRLLKALATSD
jgi:tetratricopeptide (TPR) repeat protein